MKTPSPRSVHFLLALLVVLLDRWSKRLVATHIAMYRHVQVIPGFFRLTHTENTGAAFSLFADSPSHWKAGLLIGFSVIAMVIVSVLLWKQALRAHHHGNRALSDSGRRGGKSLGPRGQRAGRGFSAVLRKAVSVAGFQSGGQRDRGGRSVAGDRDSFQPHEKQRAITSSEAPIVPLPHVRGPGTYPARCARTSERGRPWKRRRPRPPGRRYSPMPPRSECRQASRCPW